MTNPTFFFWCGNISGTAHGFGFCRHKLTALPGRFCCATPWVETPKRLGGPSVSIGSIRQLALTDNNYRGRKVDVPVGCGVLVVVCCCGCSSSCCCCCCCCCCNTWANSFALDIPDVIGSTALWSAASVAVVFTFGCSALVCRVRKRRQPVVNQGILDTLDFGSSNFLQCAHTHTLSHPQIGLSIVFFHSLGLGICFFWLNLYHCNSRKPVWFRDHLGVHRSKIWRWNSFQSLKTLAVAMDVESLSFMTLWYQIGALIPEPSMFRTLEAGEIWGLTHPATKHHKNWSLWLLFRTNHCFFCSKGVKGLVWRNHRGVGPLWFQYPQISKPTFSCVEDQRPVKASLLKRNFGSPKLVRSSPGRGHDAMAVDLDVVGCCWGVAGPEKSGEIC